MAALAPSAVFWRRVHLRRAAAQPLSARREFLRAVCIVVAVVSTSMVLQLFLVSPLQQRAAQQRLYDRFRGDLAAGTAPIDASALKGRRVIGSAIAYVEVPAINLRQVVVEGTAGGTLATGPGHRRDTVFPGQAGTSVVMGRRAAFGGPFAHIGELRKDDLIRVTTGAGKFSYRVLGVRESGERAPNLPQATEGRLVLETATGAPFLPSGVQVVDAKMVHEALGGARPSVTAKSLPRAERVLSIDTSTLWRLVLWLQAVLALTLGAVWAWHRWHPAKTWITFLPALMLVGLFAAGEFVRVLPNLL